MEHQLLSLRLLRAAAGDGELPNGHAPEVGAAEWVAFLDALEASGWPTSWYAETSPIWPVTLDDLHDEERGCFSVQVSDTVRVNVFPSWGLDCIWFDFSLREVQTQDDTDRLSDFVRLLGRSVHRPVLLSHEGSDELVFATYQPSTDTIVTPGSTTSA